MLLFPFSPILCLSIPLFPFSLPPFCSSSSCPLSHSLPILTILTPATFLVLPLIITDVTHLHAYFHLSHTPILSPYLRFSLPPPSSSSPSSSLVSHICTLSSPYPTLPPLSHSHSRHLPRLPPHHHWCHTSACLLPPIPHSPLSLPILTILTPATFFVLPLIIAVSHICTLTSPYPPPIPLLSPHTYHSHSRLLLRSPPHHHWCHTSARLLPPIPHSPLSLPILTILTPATFFVLPLIITGVTHLHAYFPPSHTPPLSPHPYHSHSRHLLRPPLIIAGVTHLHAYFPPSHTPPSLSPSLPFSLPPPSSSSPSSSLVSHICTLTSPYPTLPFSLPILTILTPATFLVFPLIITGVTHLHAYFPLSHTPLLSPHPYHSHSRHLPRLPPHHHFLHAYFPLSHTPLLSPHPYHSHSRHLPRLPPHHHWCHTSARSLQNSD